jgi:hypothetical protein
MPRDGNARQQDNNGIRNWRCATRDGIDGFVTIKFS